MSLLELILDDLRSALKRVLPGVAAVVTVMLLLRGFGGSVQAIQLQIVTLATSFLGAGEGMGGVLLHTLPLAIAAAVATFAIARRMIRFESQVSILVLALIVLAGASVGGFLRQFAPKPTAQRQPTVSADSKPTPSQETTRTAKGISIGIQYQDAPLDLAAVASRPAAVKAPVPRASALEQLRRINWLAQPNLGEEPQREIEPLALLPKMSGIPGIAAKAINQLLGFLVAYQPRLFLAAVVAGSWVGWSWHRRLQKLEEYAADCQEREDRNKPELRRAA